MAGAARLSPAGSGRGALIWAPLRSAAFSAPGLVVILEAAALGGGIPLFANAERQDPLELVEAKTHKSGIVQLFYEPKKKN